MRFMRRRMKKQKKKQKKNKQLQCTENEDKQ